MRTLTLALATLVLTASACLSTVAEGTDAGTGGGGGTVTGGGLGGGGGGCPVGGGGQCGVGGGGGDGGGIGGGAPIGGGDGGGTGGGPIGGGGPVGGGGGGAPCGCTSQLGCVPGDSPLACGTGGGACTTCQNGEQCVAGACVVAACGPQTCSGCCAQGFCVTAGMQSRLACGLGGGMCTQCNNGDTCDATGTCAPSPCDAMSCAGCCANGQCRGGTSNRFCGVGGNSCQNCGMSGGSCSAGQCVVTTQDGGTTTVDAGTPSPIGGPCTGGGAAGGGQTCANGQCIPENSFGGSSGFPGGYCTTQCGANQPCAAGSTCVATSAFGVSASACWATCPDVGVQSTCRTGYVCQGLGAGATGGYCRPNCTNGGLAGCQNNTTCNTTTGLCQ
jgi:hypothetical protein